MCIRDRAGALWQALHGMILLQKTIWQESMYGRDLIILENQHRGTVQQEGDVYKRQD